MEPYYSRDGIEIYVGDNREVLPHIPPVHAVVTDPPYGLSFMGKGWDHQVPGIPFWQAISAAMLPGAHLLSFGGDRTMHRMMTAVEDAGFEIRTQLAWIFGSGFPKSRNISTDLGAMIPAESQCSCARHLTQTVPDSPADYPARHHSGDALLPAVRDSVLSAVPSQGGVHVHNRDDLHTGGQDALSASTSLDEGTGHLSTGHSEGQCSHLSVGCLSTDSIPSGTALSTSHALPKGQRRTALHTPDTWSSVDDSASSSCSPSHSGYSHLPYCTTCGGVVVPEGLGTALKPAMELICMARKPFSGTVAANVLQHGTGAINVDACRIGTDTRENQPASTLGNGISMSGGMAQPNRASTLATGRWPANVILDEAAALQMGEPARYFYVAKASRRERNLGLDGMPERVRPITEGHGRGVINTSKKGDGGVRENRPTANHHPTVKPLALMRYLIQMVTPPGGIVLDPFMGSGSTLVAAAELGFHAIGIELSEEYAEIAAKRVDYTLNQKLLRLPGIDT